MNKLSFQDLNAGLIARGIESVVSHLVGPDNYNRSGSNLQMSSYLGGKGNSFVVCLEGSKTPGMWFENNTAEGPGGRSSGDLAEYWCMVNGVDKKTGYRDIKAYLGMGDGALRPTLARSGLRVVKTDQVKAEEKKKRLVEHLAGGKLVSSQSLKKFRSSLRQNESALDYLHQRGLTTDTINHFHLGLSQKYVDKTGAEHKDALTFPLMNRLGQLIKPYAYYNIPGVSLNPATDNGWCASSPRLSYNTEITDKHQYIFVAEGFKDQWIIHQMIQGTDLADLMVVVTSSHGSNVPLEVQSDPTIFAGIKGVYLGFDGDDAGEAIGELWAPYIGEHGYRVRPYKSAKKGEPKDWTDWFNQGHDVEEFAQLLADAESVLKRKLQNTPTNLNDYKPNRTYAYNPIDISGAYVNGHLYYSVIAHETGLDPMTNTMAHAMVRKVVRSDGEVLDYTALPVLRRPGALETPIYALSDGTLISDVPKVPPNPSWHWDDIQRWIKGESKPRTIGHIVAELITYLRGQVWLPHEEDYVVLALTAVVTFVQSVFQAVPYLLATGEAGTGKSQLGMAMVNITANGTLLGDTSAATITRTLDQTRGFLVLDDIEKLAKSMKGGTGQTDDLLQILKVSYKKSTATRAVTDTKTMAVKMLDFYGVKLMTNTGGMEEILGTRTLFIHTRKVPNGKFKAVDADEERLGQLRAEMHAWAMNNIEKVKKAYTPYPKHERMLEITAPLRAMADLCKKPEYHEAIDTMLALRDIENRCADSPESLLKDAVLRLARRGYTSIAVEHAIMEMSLLVPENFMKEHTTDIPWWRKSGDVRKALYQMGYIPRSSESRFRPYGRVGLMREYDLEPVVFADMNKRDPDAQSKIEKTIRGREFCKHYSACSLCPYESVECEIRNKTSKTQRAGSFEGKY